MNKTNKLPDYRNSSYDFFDGDDFITFDVIAVGEEQRLIFVAVSNRGKITMDNYELMTDRDGEKFFYYGSPEQKIYLNNFEQAV